MFIVGTWLILLRTPFFTVLSVLGQRTHKVDNVSFSTNIPEFIPNVFDFDTRQNIPKALQDNIYRQRFFAGGSLEISHK